MKVLKFGGTSVGSVESLSNVRDIVLSQTTPCVVVVSAPSGMTDRLLALAAKGGAMTPLQLGAEIDTIRQRFNSFINALIPQHRREDVACAIESLLARLADATRRDDLDSGLLSDLIVSFGERMSATFVAAMLDDAARIDTLSVIQTDHTRRRLAEAATFGNITAALGTLAKNVTVVEGFIAGDPWGQVSNLGRGGSDFTAAIIACALHAEVVEIWTDVDGYMTADPRKDPTATLIPELSYDKAFEMSLQGAKVVYAPAMEIVRRKHIPMTVRNTFRPNAPYSTIREHVESEL